MLFDIPVSWLIIFVGYLFAGIWLGIVKGWPLRAGLAMAFFWFLPVFWPDRYAGASGLGYMILHAAMFAIPALLIIGSILAAWIRWAFGDTKKPTKHDP